MPPKKRVSKKAAAAAAAAAAEEAVQQDEPQEAPAEPLQEDPSDPVVASEPVVLQLLIPNERMTEIVDAMTVQEPSRMDPEPYTPMEPYMLSNGGIHTGMHSAMEGVPATSHEGTGAHGLVCFWCCHSIVDQEFGMPIRYDSVHNSFTLYGCFCSLECAAAHNFSMHMGSDRAWEIHSWIQLLARRYGLSGRVRPAPSRFLLKLFNGPLTIEEFRGAHKDLARTYVMNIPPFIHVSSQMEVLNTSFMSASTPKPPAIGAF
jgi:hypothetical protein